MGYDLYIWDSPRPLDYADGLPILNTLANQDASSRKDNPNWHKTDPKPVFLEFYNRLTERYPCISSDDPRAELSPWKFGPLVDAFRGNIICLSWTWGEWDDVLSFVTQTAAQLNLICLDDQQGHVFFPEENPQDFFESEKGNQNVLKINESQKAFQTELYRRVKENDWDGWSESGTFQDSKSGMTVTALKISPEKVSYGSSSTKPNLDSSYFIRWRSYLKGFLTRLFQVR